MEGDSPDSNRKTHLPMMKILADNVSGIIIVNRWGTFQNVLKRSSGFCTLDDIDHIFQCNLGIGNDGRKQECMGMTAGIAEDPRHPKQKDRVSLSEFTGIAAVPDQTAGMATGTGDQI